MSVRRLPVHPDLDQLKHQAKDFLRAIRDGDADAIAELQRQHPEKIDAATAKLADAQLVLAREYGFESWPKLVHHVESLNPEGLEQFESIARDFVAAFQGDADALARLNERFSDTKTVEELRHMVQERQRRLGVDAADTPAYTLAQARQHVANALGFENWDSLAASVRQKPGDPRTAPRGLSPHPPFYRIDWSTNTLEPRQPLTEKDWDDIVDVIREQGITSVRAGGQMTDAALERVSHLGHVTSLNFGGTKRLTDEGLAALSRMPQLQELDLSDYPGGQLTDRGLEVLCDLPELRQFLMCWQRGVSDGGVANLSFCDKLERVDLLGSPTGDGAIDALRGKPRLRHFKTGRLVTDAGLSLLHDFPVFKTWQGGEPRYGLMTFGDAEPNFLMLDGPFSDAGLATLVRLDGVFGLGFFWHVSGLTPNGLQPLAGCANLGTLAVDGNLCDDVAMRHIAAIPKLRMLMAQGTVASDEGFVALSRSQTIEYIWGRECPNLRGRGFAALANMPALKGLAVSCKHVDDASLATLPKFPSLTWLLPMDVTDDGFRHVGLCERLEKLTCMYCRDTGDAATEHIAGLSRLKEYYAGQTRITDRSLEILSGMTSLEEVALSACAGISDAGLVHLAKLPRLRKVAVDASARVSRAGIAVFPDHVHVDFWT
ncbi:MAG: hypothetical protein ACREMQ_14735 [Longimicrobiales bacterium]